MNVKAGDTVAVLMRSVYQSRHPSHLTKVTKVTSKRIYTEHDKFWDIETGRPLFSRTHEWASSCSTVGISNDPEHIQPLLDKAAADREARERTEREIAERDARTTYQLASEIVASWSKDPIADLELLGEAKLQEIVTAIAAAKAKVVK